MTDFVPVKPVHEKWQINVYMVSEDPYERLNITNMIYPNWIVSHVVSGQVRTGGGAEELNASSGDVMIHPPDLPFFEHSGQSGVHQWMSLEVVGDYNMDIFKRFPVSSVIRLTDPLGYRHTFNELLARWNEPSRPFRDMGILAGVTRLITFILESWEAQGSPVRSNDLTIGGYRFLPVIRYMSKHMDMKISRVQLADIVHLNANYFDRVFQEAYGITPMQMLREIRLGSAKKLLETSDDSLASIAAACGMGDAAYLNRQFVKSFGMTPGQYRSSVLSARMNYIRGFKDQI